MRESEAREQSLRRQLDGLQGKLAEAEARAAVAGTQMGSAAHDADDRATSRRRSSKAMQRMRAAEERSAELSQELAAAKIARARRSEPMFGRQTTDADERVRVAEAKAAKALAAARAAQAGLTVSSADLAAIESGLVVTADREEDAVGAHPRRVRGWHRHHVRGLEVRAQQGRREAGGRRAGRRCRGCRARCRRAGRSRR